MRWRRPRYVTCQVPGCTLDAPHRHLPPLGGYESGGPVATREIPPRSRHGQVEPDVSVPPPLPPDPIPPCGKPGCLIETPDHRHIGWGPSRPHPAANAWPDDAVTVSYAELRRLVALHLDHARQGMPHDQPWEWLRLRAGAVRDGEAPLLLSEVMEP